MADVEVCLPSGAVSEKGDIGAPTRDLLRELNLLPGEGDLAKAAGFSSAFGGPPDSVALLEAGATAASKWWAAGLAATVAGAWSAATTWWDGSDGDVRTTTLWAAATVSAAALIGIAYLLGSDVRGRAAVQTETVRARASVAEAFIRAAEQVHAHPTPPAPATSASQLVGLPVTQVRHLGRHDQDKDGWRAVAVLRDGTSTTYLLVKGSTHEWVEAADVAFLFPAPARPAAGSTEMSRSAEPASSNGRQG